MAYINCCLSAARNYFVLTYFRLWAQAYLTEQAMSVGTEVVAFIAISVLFPSQYPMTMQVHIYESLILQLTLLKRQRQINDFFVWHMRKADQQDKEQN